MPTLQKITAISLLLSGLLLWATTALAAPVATVTNLSGPLAVRTATGAIKALGVGSRLDEGDTVVTERRTYARLKFTDGSEVTLKPNSQFRIDRYAFDQAKPREDAGTFSLIRGGLRTITGKIGKRGNKDSYRMQTPTATIGIRGTIYDATYCSGGSCGAIRPGLYLGVTYGSVVITNSGGVPTTLQLHAGQFAFVQSPMTPPVMLPSRPNIPFNPPVSMGGATTSGRPGSTGGGGECQVR